MFLKYYNLFEQPFGVTPDPRYLFLSQTHREALASLQFGLACGRGFLTIIAKPGMGKTTLLFQLLRQLDSSARTVFLFQTQANSRDLLRSLAVDLDIPIADDHDIMRIQFELNQFVLREAEEGRRLVVVIDEAQNLDTRMLEMIRQLSNFETPSQKLMQIILAGQPELATRLQSPELRQLRQRLSIIATLRPFTLDDTNAFIDMRLRVAGYKFHNRLFTDGARLRIAQESEGIPRNINNLCFNALALGCASGMKIIDEGVIEEVVRDLSLDTLDAIVATTAASTTPPKPGPVSLDAAPQRSVLRNWAIRSALILFLILTLRGPLSPGQYASMEHADPNLKHSPRRTDSKELSDTPTLPPIPEQLQGPQS